MQSALRSVPSSEDEFRAAQAERDRLVKAHLPLVRRIATAIHSSAIGAGIPLDDLVAYGANGLLDAAGRFDAEREVPFEVFARYRIRGAVVDGIRHHHWLPRRAYKRLCAERVLLDATPANDVGERRDGSSFQRGAPGPRYFDIDQNATLAGDATESAWGGSGQHSDARWNGRRMFQPVVEEDDRLQIQLKTAITRLPAKERRLVELTYFEGKTLADAGAALGMQRSWASRLHARAIVQLRAALSS
jgi:RNA polymerase sigma factor for flagellar operon FliA